ncbi:protease [Xanthomonas translucens pv. poae]|uniref:Protease n=1 Tax=Xanthomonas graminis pv. poae TaxID=227946 RepID=A0A0K3A2R6_9XANT|nr:S53 family serine peptidase [Xanthomonas translucens]UKE62477.1 S53 family serine peptidase [Xanthomonas translucens pv. poae]CTP91562.1 protease [Xanthomonas translucens pv. poae]
MIDRSRRQPLLAAVLSGCALVFGTAHAAQDATLAAMSATLRAAPVTFDVQLPLRDQAGLDALLADIHDPVSPQYHHWLSRPEFERRFAPLSAQVERVRAALQAAHMTVTQQGATLHVNASADTVERLFSAPLTVDLHKGANARLAVAGPLQLPAALRDSGAVVTGLTGGLPPFQVDSRSLLQIDPDSRRGPSGAYAYNDLKQAYGYPSYQSMIGPPGQQRRLDGTGTTIAILIPSDVLDSDVDTLFNKENFSRYGAGHVNPKLYARRYVAGAKPGINEQGGAGSEAALDVEMALAGAPGAHVLLYVIPDLTEASIIAGYRQIVQDNEADVVSSSFGGCELYYTAAYNGGKDYTSLLRPFDAVFKQGNAQGITFIASSGDNAGLDCPDAHYMIDGKDGNFVVGVNQPAMNANVTAVGGTNLSTNYQKGSLDSSYRSENAYADPLVTMDYYGVGAQLAGGYWGAGGGVSTLTQRPAYQLRALGGTRASMRALPDVGMLVGGCPTQRAKQPCGEGRAPFSSSVLSVYKGEFYTSIGTSVAAPEFASVAALLVEKQGRQGNLNDYLYRLAANSPQAFHRAIPGNNGVVGNDVPLNGKYSYTTGLGTPIVRLLIGALDAAPAGIPRSPSNP